MIIYSSIFIYYIKIQILNYYSNNYNPSKRCHIVNYETSARSCGPWDTIEIFPWRTLEIQTSNWLLISCIGLHRDTTLKWISRMILKMRKTVLHSLDKSVNFLLRRQGLFWAQRNFMKLLVMQLKNYWKLQQWCIKPCNLVKTFKKKKNQVHLQWWISIWAPNFITLKQLANWPLKSQNLELSFSTSLVKNVNWKNVELKR